MARQRRGGGFRPPELPLRGTLGTLLRTAAAQVGPLRDALERTAREGLREGRERLDEALAARSSARSSSARSSSARSAPGRAQQGRRPLSSRTARRDDDYADALSDLGAIVLDLIRQGEIDLAELPEVRDIVAQLDELDAASAPSSDHVHDDDDHDEDIASPPSRNRFDSRRRDPARSQAHNDADDGTVSSNTWRPTTTKATPAKKQPARVWRPPPDNYNEEEAPPPPTNRRADPITSRGRAVPRPKDPLRKGGISFDDDDDALADYMHPDDVPPKPPKDGDS